MTRHTNDCECAGCRDGIKAVQDRQREMMEKHGWIVHYVTHDHDCSPTGVNIHTHGLPEKFGHLDIQIVCPLSQMVAHGVLYNCVAKIKEGKTFVPGEVVEGLVTNGYKVKFVQAREMGRDVLRLIIPDKSNNVERGDLTHPFAIQYEGTI
jgi:hypothetical protein